MSVYLLVYFYLCIKIGQFSDEASYKSKFKEYRNCVGIVCSECGGKEHFGKEIKNNTNVT